MKKNNDLRLILITVLLAAMLIAMPLGTAQAVYTSSEIFNVQIHLPEGARIDYLRLYYYDKSTAYNQSAFLTVYEGNGDTTDLTNVSSTGSVGYGENLSDYVGHIVANELNTYVLNWRPILVNSSMRLMGMRVAYRLPLGGGSWSSFYYRFVPGSVFTPRNSNTEWGYAGGGGIYATSYTFLPYIKK
ncbi:MAG: hypothetical protein WA110_07610 [Anaerolineaceae bacterium]